MPVMLRTPLSLLFAAVALTAQPHPLEALITAARENSPRLKELLASGLPGLAGRDGAAVWGQEFLFAVQSPEAATVSIDHGPPLAMRQVTGSPYWYLLKTLRLGTTHHYAYAAGGKLLKSAFAHEFILQLPQGYDTQVGERGVNLSGGQRQRIAIARAFIRNAPILVLDEATAALDSKAEAEVQAAIDALAEHRTVICVAHRLSTLASMNQVIVLSEGRIIETGGFDELVRAKGLFASMAARQGIFAGV